MNFALRLQRKEVSLTDNLAGSPNKLVMVVSSDETELKQQLASLTKMTTQRQSFPSFASIISLLSIVFYCVGFIRIELELNQNKKRINDLESVAEITPHSNEPHVQFRKAVPDMEANIVYRNKRQSDSHKNATGSKSTEAMIHTFNKLLLEGRLQLCQSKRSSGIRGPPGLPGPRGARGRRGQKGKTGNKGDKGAMGSPGKRGKQGIMGNVGVKGETGTKGQKGDRGDTGMPGTKGEPGQSLSPPTVVVSPATLTVNKGGSASFQCSGSGNPEPAMVWSKVNSQSEISQSSVSGGKLRLEKVTGNDSGLYQCSAANILGESRKLVRLVVTNVRPRILLHPGPHYAVEGNNHMFPVCHVTGNPAPVVTWRKSAGQLLQGRVEYNNSALRISHVRKDDSGAYFCSAVNRLGKEERKTVLVVVSLPRFTVKPPRKVSASIGGTITLNCQAKGDPQPVITWKRQGAQLPVRRSNTTNQALILSNVKIEDAGNYVCEATSAGVFHIEAISDVEVRPQRVRLVNGGTSFGRVEVYKNGKWGNVCDDLWDINDAKVVCRELGFSQATAAPTRAKYGQGSGPILMSEVNCRGEEPTLTECRHRHITWSQNYGCYHYKDASVECI